MDLVGRVKGLLLDPKAEWQVIAARAGHDAGDLLKNYVAILAAIPAVCGFIGARSSASAASHAGSSRCSSARSSATC